MTGEDKFPGERPQGDELNDEELEGVSGGGSGKNPISDMSEQDMFRLQRLMEQKGQLESMISNTIKAGSDTAGGIASNLKH